MRRAAGAVFAIAAAMVLAGCSGGSQGDGRDCITVSQSLMSQIASGANNIRITPVKAAAVRSKSFKEVYIVAMSVRIAGVEDPETGVWGVTDLMAGHGSTVAVDGIAQQFTDWPDQVNGHKLNVTEDGVTEAKACLSH